MDQKKILLVDDVRLFLNLEETFFRRTGCEIKIAQTGVEAIKIARQEKPDLILLDLLMPEMNGDEVCRILKSDSQMKSTKVIMVTTQADEETVRRCKQAGCDDFVTKPINQRDLLRRAALQLGIPYRVHFRILVRVEVEGESDQGFFMGTSSDISLSGMLVESDKRLEMDSGVFLQFAVPGEKNIIRVRGKVARVDELSFRDRFGLGIHFEDITSEQKSSLMKFIRTRIPDGEEV